VTLPIGSRYAPAEAKPVHQLPVGPEWSYEPKWDGFRCLAFRDREKVSLMSKAGKPLTRYFPDVVATILALRAQRFVLDGEIVVPVGGTLSFDQLLQRIHPAASRVRMLAASFPAQLIAFDILAIGETSLIDHPFAERRQRLESFVRRFGVTASGLRLSPMTRSAPVARRWLGGERRGLDGVVAKRLDLPYESGKRTGMEKVKNVHTADCVVGGFRYASKGRAIGSLLLGLYDAAGLLDHVGFVSSFTSAERATLASRVTPLVGGSGFTGRAPGGPSRWSTERSGEWVPLRPALVVEVAYDHFADRRFRHGTAFRRWRPDKAARQCTTAQLRAEGRSALQLLRLGVNPKRTDARLSSG
jgi:ATP-dependent DNA ligase